MYVMTLVTGQEHWVCHDVGYRTGTMGMSLRWLQDRNNGYVITLVTAQEQWACHDVGYSTGTMGMS